MKPTDLDEFPVHQAPVPMARVATSDRNFYDRSYLNAHDREGTFLVTGLGHYPNLGVKDAYATVRRGDTQWTTRFSDALDTRTTDQEVGGYRVEVLEPLSKLRVVCESESLSFDLEWNGSFPALLEERHLLFNGPRTTLDAQRFTQVGTWAGTLNVDGTDIAVSPETWVGARDRSWGIRPVGDGEPAGRSADSPLEGFWWVYLPLRFDDFALIMILQEEPDGFRTLNDARRVFADGRVEQLGWPRIDIRYRSGSRHPEAATVHLTTPEGKPLVVEIETVTSIALQIGAGYGGDPDWSHGQWKGRDWSSASVYDLTSPEIIARLPWGISDHVARARCDGRTGWGMFEHASMGRHDPTGFADWTSLAP
ncbi:hypothetical protein FPZ12_004190 [Amycolatopsis acidicola]|uniref:Uncharacterized protein n=2 Tax=Amycolatopsis acidicola TaxID=2596893 RepID=A0A5N0VLH5_9PSEU|nr:hypothetical protein FPZ12_004190 [Amycolatopsis acidicola]